MARLSVVHIAPTALAGAPAALSEALTRYTEIRSSLIQTGDYVQANRLVMAPNMIRFAPRGPITDHCRYLLRHADIVHVHNNLPVGFLPFLVSLKLRAKFILHIHSPLYERPLFIDPTLHVGVPFAAKFVVCHFHPRCYPDARPMPNIVHRSAPPVLEADPSTLRVIFSPSHRTGGRWNAKTTPAFQRSLVAIRHIPGVEVLEIDASTPQELFELRCQCHVSIDEVVSGSFHLVSLEGLAVGNVVINAADQLSLWAARMGFRAPEAPPFVYATSKSLASTIADLARDRKAVWELQQRAREYYERYLMPQRLASFYAEEYAAILRS